MGLIGAAASAIGSAISGACSAIGGAIGGALSGVAGALSPVLGPMVAEFGAAIAGVAGALGLTPLGVIAIVVVAVCAIAVAVGLKEPGKDDPDEMAMKAEKAEKDGVKPENFNSYEEYINYLHDQVELTEEEVNKLKQMSPEECAAYQIAGCCIYAKGIAEKLGFDAPLDPMLLRDFSKMALEASSFVRILTGMKESGITDPADLSKYLRGDMKDGVKAGLIEDCLIHTLSDDYPDLSIDEIEDKLDDMKRVVKGR